ncbi:MAG: carboxypeptidase-like regulatory domain-containing protein, partial [Bryobacteraceae bacterium]|nr:carboxypeptidase-like regulatory domain-containing protein [Bryobacteraceae bacterium]
VVDSVTQAPVRKAQLTVMSRGGQVGMSAIPAVGGGGGGGGTAWFNPASRMGSVRSTGVLGTNGVIVGGLMPGGMMSGGGMGQPSISTTDSSGSFVLRDLPPGRYAVQAFHTRYPVGRTGPVVVETEVKAGETTRVTVALVPPASLTGRIVDEDGDPIAGCSAQVRAPEGSPAGMNGMSSEVSNERGEYRLWGFTAGRYLVFAQCMRPIFQPRPFSAGPPPPPSLSYPVQYYPQSADAAAATPLEFAPGVERTGVDFQLKPARVFSVSGKLSGFETSGNRNLSVVLSNPKERFGFAFRGGRVDPATGTFEIQNVFPGSHVLSAIQHATDSNTPTLNARLPIEVTDRSLQVNLVLQKAVDIPGMVVIEGDRAVPPQQVQVQTMPDEQSSGAPPPRVEMQPDGSFVMKNTPAGIWRIQVFGPGIYLRAIEVGGQPLPGQTLDTTNGVAGPIRVIVSTRTASVKGRGNPGLMYVFVRDGMDPRFGGGNFAHADPQGNFQMQGLAPGSYKVYEGNVPDEAMLLQTVSVAEGAALDMDLTRRPSGSR